MDGEEALAEAPAEEEAQDIGQEPQEDTSAAPQEQAQTAEPTSWRQKEEQLRAEARLAREEADRWRQMAEYNQRQQQPQQPQYNPMQDETLDPEQRVAAALQQMDASHRMNNLATGVYIKTELDNLTFQGFLERNPQLKRFEKEVQAEYNQIAQEFTRTGRPDLIPPRLRLLNERVGADALKRGTKAVAQAQETAKRNIQRQTTRPMNAGSNVSRTANSESPAQAARRRLRDAFPDAGY